MDTVMLTKTKRNRLETLNAILTTSAKGVKKTHIMYRTNLSHQQLKKFLDFLTSKGLLVKEGDYYNTTSKGLIFIEQFEKIQLLMLLS